MHSRSSDTPLLRAVEGSGGGGRGGGRSGPRRLLLRPLSSRCGILFAAMSVLLLLSALTFMHYHFNLRLHLSSSRSSSSTGTTSGGGSGSSGVLASRGVHPPLVRSGGGSGGQSTGSSSISSVRRSSSGGSSSDDSHHALHGDPLMRVDGKGGSVAAEKRPPHRVAAGNLPIMVVDDIGRDGAGGPDPAPVRAAYKVGGEHNEQPEGSTHDHHDDSHDAQERQHDSTLEVDVFLPLGVSHAADHVHPSPLPHHKGGRGHTAKNKNKKGGSGKHNQKTLNMEGGGKDEVHTQDEHLVTHDDDDETKKKKADTVGSNGLEEKHQSIHNNKKKVVSVLEDQDEDEEEVFRAIHRPYSPYKHLRRIHHHRNESSTSSSSASSDHPAGATDVVGKAVPPPPPPPLAYVLIISNELFVDGALVLGASLRRHSEQLRAGTADLTIIIPEVLVADGDDTAGGDRDELNSKKKKNKKKTFNTIVNASGGAAMVRVGADSQRRLLSEGGFDEIIIVPSLAARAPGAFWKDTFDKLYMFDLVQYERVVFMDADMVCIRSMDRLLTWPDFSSSSSSSDAVAAGPNNSKEAVVGRGNKNINNNNPYLQHLALLGPQHSSRQTWRFHYDHVAAIGDKNGFPGTGGQSYFQTGMMVLMPNRLVFSEIMEEFEGGVPPRGQSYNHGLHGRDGVLLRNYFKERFMVIDNAYSRNLNPRYRIPLNVISLHLRGKHKPWFDWHSPIQDPELGKKEFGFPYIAWWSVYERLIHGQSLEVRLALRVWDWWQHHHQLQQQQRQEDGQEQNEKLTQTNAGLVAGLTQFEWAVLRGYGGRHAGPGVSPLTHVWMQRHSEKAYVQPMAAFDRQARLVDALLAQGGGNSEIGGGHTTANNNKGKQMAVSVLTSAHVEAVAASSPFLSFFHQAMQRASAEAGEEAVAITTKKSPSGSDVANKKPKSDDDSVRHWAVAERLYPLVVAPPSQQEKKEEGREEEVRADADATTTDKTPPLLLSLLVPLRGQHLFNSSFHTFNDDLDVFGGDGFLKQPKQKQHQRSDTNVNGNIIDSHASTEHLLPLHALDAAGIRLTAGRLGESCDAACARLLQPVAAQGISGGQDARSSSPGSISSSARGVAGGMTPYRCAEHLFASLGLLQDCRVLRALLLLDPSKHSASQSSRSRSAPSDPCGSGCELGVYWRPHPGNDYPALVQRTKKRKTKKKGGGAVEAEAEEVVSSVCVYNLLRDERSRSTCGAFNESSTRLCPCVVTTG